MPPKMQDKNTVIQAIKLFKERVQETDIKAEATELCDRAISNLLEKKSEEQVLWGEDSIIPIGKKGFSLADYAAKYISELTPTNNSLQHPYYNNSKTLEKTIKKNPTAKKELELLIKNPETYLHTHTHKEQEQTRNAQGGRNPSIQSPPKDEIQKNISQPPPANYNQSKVFDHTCTTTAFSCAHARRSAVDTYLSRISSYYTGLNILRVYGLVQN